MRLEDLIATPEEEAKARAEGRVFSMTPKRKAREYMSDIVGEGFRATMKNGKLALVLRGPLARCIYLTAEETEAIHQVLDEEEQARISAEMRAG